jgi:IS5 family transposase
LIGAVAVRSLKGCDYRTTEDLIKNYLPARYMCNLENSTWTPDHNTIWVYETMLGVEGIKEVTDYVLRAAAKSGYADPKGLCSDTTAQEANIPYPNEVGHMNSFLKSLQSNLATLGKNAKALPRKIISGIKSKFSEVAKKVRSHRLFAKTQDAKKIINEELFALTSSMVSGLGDLLTELDLKKNQIKGSGKTALNNLGLIFNNMNLMLPQILTWITKGKVVSGKIISLFNTEFRAIKRGKMGKKVEFGLKYGINQIRGGYVSIFTMCHMMGHDAEYSVQAIKEHIRIFGQPPKDYGFDRGGWSQEHLKEIKKLKVKNIAVSPKGKSKWLVGPQIQEKMISERTQVEGKIGTMKSFGFNKPKAKTNPAVIRTALMAGLCLNLKRFAKDLANTKAMQMATAS